MAAEEGDLASVPRMKILDLAFCLTLYSALESCPMAALPHTRLPIPTETFR